MINIKSLAKQRNFTQDTKGRFRALTRDPALLQQKFGTLPEWAVERVRHADSSALQQWALRVLQANALEAVFQ